MAQGKSRADYYRQRRKGSPTRLVDAESDAERKREARGGYRQNSQILRWKQTLSDEERVIVEARYEFEHPYAFGPGSLDPIPFGLFPKDDKPVILPSPLQRPQQTPEDLPKRLSLSASARAQRRKDLKRHFDQETLDAWKFANSPEGAQWIAERWPGEEARVLEPIRGRG